MLVIVVMMCHMTSELVQIPTDLDQKPLLAWPLRTSVIDPEVQLSLHVYVKDLFSHRSQTSCL